LIGSFRHFAKKALPLPYGMKLNSQDLQIKVSSVEPYPLVFEEISIGKVWGGRQLSNWTSAPLPNIDIGEVWLLSDRINKQSVVKSGALKGMSIGKIMEQAPEFLLGKFTAQFQTFPLLIKLLNVKSNLSVQVHPQKENAKTEAWIILDATDKSRIYAGLKPNSTKDDLRTLCAANIDELIPSFTPKVWQSIFIKAGTIHSMQNDLVILEVQQNSDTTLRLYDWEQIDKTTNLPRELQVENAIENIDFAQGNIEPIIPIIETTYPIRRELIISCPFFTIWRIYSRFSFFIGENNVPTIIFCAGGSATITKSGIIYKISKGNLILLPAALGECEFKPIGEAKIIIIKLPESPTQNHQVRTSSY
jgi:mannose-6-phosphate isomerase